MPLPIYTSAAFTNGSGVSVASNASVEVRRESDGSLVPIFEDRDGENQITQPGFQADLEGRFEFYADPSADGWEITVTSGSDTHTLNSQFPQGGVFGIPEGERAINSQELLAAVSEAADVDEAVSFVGRGAIVESGTNSNGSYIRWENGEQVCFRSFRDSNVLATSVTGALFRSDVVRLDFPSEFTQVVSVAGVHYGESGDGGGGGFVRFFGPSVGSPDWDSMRLYSSEDNLPFSIQLIAWGFWK